MSYIKVENISRIYKVDNLQIVANDNINFEVEKGEFVIILGPSGSGKSTLLNILGGMDRASSGNYYVDGLDITKLNNKKLTKFRRENIGFVFQFYNLIPNLTAFENIEIATELVNDKIDASEAIKMVELENRKSNFPYQLSGGEQQRISIARAIAKKPQLLLCDEPTGALDYKTSKLVLKLLYDICKNTNTTVILITHNNAIADMADKIIEIKDSKIKKITINENKIPIEEIEW